MTTTPQPIVKTKVTIKTPKSVTQLYIKQEQKEGQYCYKPYRNLRNYLT